MDGVAVGDSGRPPEPRTARRAGLSCIMDDARYLSPRLMLHFELEPLPVQNSTGPARHCCGDSYEGAFHI